MNKRYKQRAAEIKQADYYFPLIHYLDAELRMLELIRRVQNGHRVLRPTCGGFGRAY